MSKDHDKQFVISFAGVLALLVGIAVVIIIMARFVTPGDKAATNAELKKVEARTTPLVKVITDPALLVKVASAVKRAPLSGEQVYATVCSACHEGGLLNAPKVSDKAAWSARKASEGGVDGLTGWAIKGKNSMPARGGNADLTDDEIKAAVELMLSKSGA